MRKLIYIFIFSALAFPGVAFAVPTSTIVQNLFITGQKSVGFPCLTINSVGFITTSTCGGTSVSFPIPYASTTGVQADLQSAYVISWNGATGTVLYNPFPVPFASTTGVQGVLSFPLAYASTTHISFPIPYASTTGVQATLTWPIPVASTSLSANTPLSISGNILSIATATGAVNGLLTSSDWLNFASKATSSITISSGLGLSGGGDLTANRTLTLNMLGITCGGTDKVSAISATGTAICSTDQTGGGAAFTTTTINGLSSTTYIFATSGPAIIITGSGSTLTWSLSTSTLGLSTTQISEGNGLYFTDVRARAVWNQDLYSTSSPTFRQLTVSATSTFPSGIWNSLGNVGIGTTPSVPLEVEKDGITLAGTGVYMSRFGNTAATKGIVLGYDTASQTGLIAPVGASSNLAFWTHNGSAWSEKMRIDLNGNVGIGTTGPTFTGSSISSPLGIELSNTAPNLRLTRTGTGARSYSFEIDSNSAFYINDDTAGAGKERLTILSSGNVGIGTAGPTAQLTVSSTAATQAPLNLQPMVLPTSLNNGDIVVDTTSNNLTTRISGQTLYGQQVIYSQVNSISLRGTGTLANMLDLSGKGTTTLAANLLVAGKQVRITMNGFFSSPAAATSTLTWDVRVGTTSVIYATTSVPGNAAQNSFTLSGTFTTRTTGNAGTIMPAGMVQMWTTSSSAATSTWQTLPTNAAVTLSTLIPQNVVFNMKFTSGNSPVYSATSTNATIEILN